MVDLAAFTPAGDTVSLAVTGTTGRVALTQKPGTPQPEITVVVFNAGPQTAFVAFGTVTVNAVAATSMPIPAGATVEFQVNTTYQTYIAAITGSSTATLYITSGTGSLKAFGIGAGVGSAGNAVTIADGADVTEGAIADAAVAAGAAGTVNAHLRTISGQLPATVGQKAMAASLPVVLASDQSSIPVAATLAAGSNIVGNVRIDQTTPGTTNGVVVNSGTLTTVTTVTTVTTLTGTTTLTPGTGATNLGKAEDSVHASGDTGVFALGVVTDGTTSLAAVGDYGVLGTDTAGNLRVVGSITAADGATLTNALRVQAINTTYNGTTVDLARSVVNSTNSTGTGIVAAGILAQYDDTSPSSVTENQFANVRMNAARVLYVSQQITTVSATVTRPGDTNAYAANDAFSNSTSAPTSGGFTLTSAAQWSGGTGIITSAVITASAGTLYNGEIWLFDQAVTNINDNAAFTITDGEAQTLIGIIPFNTTDVTAANSVSYVTGLNIGFTCVGTANLRFLVKIMSAVTPGNAEVLSVRLQIQN